MKQLSFKSLLLGAMILSSCSSAFDDEPSVTNSSDGQVTITVNVPTSVKSRAYADGTTAASNVKYYVYDQALNNADGQSDPVLSGNVTITNSGGALAGEVTLSLAKAHTYNVIFLATATEAYSYDVSTRQMNIDYDKVTTSSEELDAFYGTIKSLKVDDNTSSTGVTLVRPFAQLNIGTNDLPEYEAATTTKPAKTSITVSGLYSAFDLMNAEVVGEPIESATFAAAELPTGETFPVSYQNEAGASVPYTYLAMDYLLVDSQKQLVNVDLTVENANNTTHTFQYENIPVQRNFRTNIYGGLLQSSANFKVAIAPGFNEPNYDFPVVSTADAMLAALAEEGGAVIPEGVSISLDDALATSSATLDITEPTELVVNGEVECSTGAQIHVKDELNINGVGTITSSLRGLIYLEDGGSVDIKNVTLDTPNPDRGCAIYVTGGESLSLENVTINAARTAVMIDDCEGVKDVNVTFKDCAISSTSSDSYAFIFYTGIETLENVTLHGVHGGISAWGDSRVTINSGTYDVGGENSSAVYAALFVNEAGQVTINGGSFSSPREHYTTFFGYDDFGCSLSIYGGMFAEKAYDARDGVQAELALPEGYEYVETGDSQYPWKVVKAQE
jgi:PBP1b-binding outer membrane lipoprotein LpoB